MISKPRLSRGISREKYIS